MNCTQVISAQADMRATHVKPRSGGRNQNYMAPEALRALEQARPGSAVAVTAMPATK
jgi:hypothetical protein